MSLTPVAQERLLRVVRLLQSMEDRRFNLATWHSKSSCGTTYCAMGFAASTAWFKERGLTLDDYGRILFTRPDGHHCYGFDAVSECIGITESQAEYLFMPHAHYSTRDQVIDRICKFVVRDGGRDRKPLRVEEKTRLDKMLTGLDVKLAVEKGGDPAALMRKVLAQGEPLVPVTS
jgi:hypothetical protein